MFPSDVLGNSCFCVNFTAKGAFGLDMVSHMIVNICDELAANIAFGFWSV